MKTVLLAIVIAAVIILVPNLFMKLGIGIGERHNETKTLRLCQEGQKITINGVDIHCGVIHESVNLAAAEYRQVKTCLVTIDQWTKKRNKR
jgi:hypothetical protein